MFRRVSVIIAVVLFGGLAIAGLSGRKEAIRRARLDQINVFRNELIQNFAEAHDIPIFPTNSIAATNGSIVREQWVVADRTSRSNLTMHITAFGEANDLEVRLGMAVLALTEQKFEDALRWVTASDENETDRKSVV